MSGGGVRRGTTGGQGRERTRRKGTCCPCCSGHSAVAGFNDLATHPPRAGGPSGTQTRNGDVTATQITAGSSRSAWWTTTATSGEPHRTTGQRGGLELSVLRRERRPPGFNDLATTHPDLAKLWHQSRNGSLTPRRSRRVRGRECGGSARTTRAISGRFLRMSGWPGTDVPCAERSLARGGHTGRRSRSAGARHDRRSHDRTLTGDRREIVPPREDGRRCPSSRWSSSACTGTARQLVSPPTTTHGRFDAVHRAGVQLFQVWEDDWNRRPVVVVRSIAHRLRATANSASALAIIGAPSTLRGSSASVRGGSFRCP